MSDLPVGKPEDEIVATVEAFKKNEGNKGKRRHEIQAQAVTILAKIKQVQSEGLVYFDEDGETILEIPEMIMARMLAGKQLKTGPRPKDEPLKVSKGTISKIGEEPK